MSGDAADLIARAFSAFNRRDENALLALCHPDIEWIPMRASLEGKVYRGLDGVRQALTDVAAEFEELRNDPRHFTEIGERVVISGRLVAIERAGGLRVDIPGAWLAEMRDGKVSYVRAFPDEDAATEAARERE